MSSEDIADHPARAHFRVVAILDWVWVGIICIVFAYALSQMSAGAIYWFWIWLTLLNLIVYVPLAWGTWRLKNWARLAHIVLAFAQVLLIPLGTLLAIYVFYWFRLKKCGALFGRPELEAREVAEL